jgi:hypothetical protein
MASIFKLMCGLHCHAETRFVLDLCKAKPIWMLPQVCYHPDISVGVNCLSSWHHIHKNHSYTVPENSDHDLARWWIILEFFLPGRFEDGATLWIVSGSKWWTQVSTAVTIWDKVIIPTTQKTGFFSWLCAWLRGSKEHILQTLSNIRNYKWLHFLCWFQEWTPVVRCDTIFLANNGISTW